MASDRDEEFAREIQAHLALDAEERIANGASAEEARDAALRLFGNVTRVREEVRAIWTHLWWDALKQDVRVGLRALSRTKSFAATALLTLALGIGANTAIFQLIDAIRWRSVPVLNPQELAIVELADPTRWRGRRISGFPVLSNPLWEEFRSQQRVFAGVLAWSNASLRLTGHPDAGLARGLYVSGEFFQQLGVPPAAGRVFDGSDDRPGCQPTAIVSHAFWQRELGSDPGVVGRRLAIESEAPQIVGVTPAWFTGLEVGRAFDVALPICSVERLGSENGWLRDASVSWLTVMGRRGSSQSLAVDNARLDALSPALFKATLPTGESNTDASDYLNLRLKASPGEWGVSALRTRYDTALSFLLVTTGLVLFVACTNLANLMLARVSTRARELAVRVALGASRGRVLRQMMVESSLLAIGGAVLGVLIADGLIGVLLGQLGSGLSLETPLDSRLLAFVTFVAGATCIGFGLIPAWQASRAGALEALKASGRALSDSRLVLRWRNTLMVAQVAVSLVLLFGALLLSSTLRNLLSVDPGFRIEGVQVLRLDFSRVDEQPEARSSIRRDALDRIRSMPGVTSAAEVRHVPLSGTGTSLRVRRTDPPGMLTPVRLNGISEGYLETMGIPLVAGRPFSTSDTLKSAKVAIVNPAFAHRLGLSGDIVGQRFLAEGQAGEADTLVEIVGVVRDTKYFALREDPLPIVFVPIAQIADPRRVADFVIRSDTPLTAASLAAEVLRIRPGVMANVHELSSTVRDGLLRERLLATLAGVLAGLAALIAGVGLYGVTSYVVARRRLEIGLRMALGASRIDILLMVLRQACGILVTGLLLGSGLSIAGSALTGSLVFGIDPSDPRGILLAGTLIAMVTMVAAFLPARRASCIPPLSVLRDS